MNIDNKEPEYKVRGKEFHGVRDVAMNFIDGKWKTVVLWYLRKKMKRFSELRRLIPGITEKMLSLRNQGKKAWEERTEMAIIRHTTAIPIPI